MKNCIANGTSIVKQSGALRKLPNIGKVLEAKLHKAGILSPEQLKEIGSKEAFIPHTATRRRCLPAYAVCLRGRGRGDQVYAAPRDNTPGFKIFLQQLVK